MWVFIITLILGLLSTNASARQIVKDEYIVEYVSSDVTDTHLYDHLDSLKIETVHKTSFSHSLFRGASFKVTNNNDIDDVSQLIQEAPMVQKVWPQAIYFPSMAISGFPEGSASFKDPPSRNPEPGGVEVNATIVPGTLSAHIMTGVDKLHAQGYTGKGMRIAILDSGVDYYHEALGSCFGPGCKFVAGHSFVDDSYSDYTTPAIGGPDIYGVCNPHGTHVSGIVGANPNRWGFTGAAPDASLEMYRIFGCIGGSGGDVLINASLAAFDSRPDVITASVGGANGWSEDPWTVVAQRINDQGVMFMLSAGNDGAQGPFFAAGAADGIDVTAVGSVDNTDFPFYYIDANYTKADGSWAPFQWMPAVPQNIPSGEYPVYAISYDTSNPADGCSPFPDSTPNLSSYIVLIQRGTCTPDDKVQNAVNAGAKYVMMYSNIDSVTGTYINEFPGFEALGILEHNTGVDLISVLATGKNLSLQIESPATASYNLSYSPNRNTAGRMASSSSWGPTYEARAFPTVSSPGGKIFSTYPRVFGNYTVLSGTSMAAPILAGIAALVLQVRGSMPVSELRALLATTARPMPFNDGSNTSYPYLAPVFQQGGGLVDAYAAAFTTTILSTDVLAFNDTEFFKSTVYFNITNASLKPVTYTLSNIGAATVYSLPADGSSVLTPFTSSIRPEMNQNYATLSISPSKVTIGSDSTAVIKVSPQLPDVDHTRLPIYSGYISVNRTDGGESVRLPYGGIAAKLSDLIILDTTLGFPYLASSLDSSTNLTADSSDSDPPAFNVPHDTVTDTSNISLPTAAFDLSFGTWWYNITVISAKDGTAVGDVGGIDNPVWVRAPGYTQSWTGQFIDGTWAEAGEYRMKLKVLKTFGDYHKEQDFQTGLTGPFILNYINNTSAK